ncbi:hypothetical protein ACHAW5_007656 [Stephanodiscus triporus]|uniref:Uncharacterized protein n=1 Tax=Stephanodiscus triporus TaxID=2934178 RepID=A0ABD3NMX5_9STRA
MRFWIKRRDKLVHSYSLVGYLLSPNQTIMDHAYENRSVIHQEAVVNLIQKLIVDPKLVGVDKSQSLAESISRFWEEYNWFARARAEKLSSAGKLWEDADFKSLKMDEYCKDMVEALDASARPTKMFRNWQETWERKPVGANGDVLLLERLQLKYIGFKLDENEGDHRVFTVHAIELKREPRRKFYQLVAVTKEFDKSLSFEDNDLMHYDVWDFCGETYDCFRVYYDEYATKIMSSQSSFKAASFVCCNRRYDTKPST